MENRLYDTEYRFMEIIWEHSPVRSGELVKLSKEALGWKKSTTYDRKEFFWISSELYSRVPSRKQAV